MHFRSLNPPVTCFCLRSSICARSTSGWPCRKIASFRARRCWMESRDRWSMASAVSFGHLRFDGEKQMRGWGDLFFREPTYLSFPLSNLLKISEHRVLQSTRTSGNFLGFPAAPTNSVKCPTQKYGCNEISANFQFSPKKRNARRNVAK